MRGGVSRDQTNEPTETDPQNPPNLLHDPLVLTSQLNPEKSLSQFDPTQALETFHLNSIGHLVLYKHLQRFIPTLREFEKIRAGGFASGQGEQEDPANGWVRPEGSVCLSTSARVGSIADNRMGGWYSYRA